MIVFATGLLEVVGLVNAREEGYGSGRDSTRNYQMSGLPHKRLIWSRVHSHACPLPRHELEHARVKVDCRHRCGEGAVGIGEAAVGSWDDSRVPLRSGLSSLKSTPLFCPPSPKPRISSTKSHGQDLLLPIPLAVKSSRVRLYHATGVPPRDGSWDVTGGDSQDRTGLDYAVHLDQTRPENGT